MTLRVGVVGASGSCGTALLRALHDDPDVRADVAVVRRAPTTTPPAPYDAPRWVSCDIGDPDERAVVARLREAFDGLDAVVNLAWQIQPSHDRERLRRTAVDGTRRVVRAAVHAGVPHLVVASSVGAYSPAHDDTPRAEDWPTGGVPTSAYSVDKVAVERLLDDAEHELAVARLRPALVFQRAAGSSIERYFLGPALPGRVLSRTLPVLPWPSGVRVQAVHADDLAHAYRAVLAGRHTGAFNVAADDVVRAGDVADLLAGGRVLSVPRVAVREALRVAWAVRAAHLSPGWLDLAGAVPVLDTTRARDVLGWRPARTGLEALADVVAGMVDGAGTASPVLRPRRLARPSPVGGQSAST